MRISDWSSDVCSSDLHGLPSEEKNKDAWPLMRPLLADPALAPDKAARERSLSAFEMFLRIRNSSPLFRLRDDAAVREHLRFLTTGPAQIPGVIVMSLAAGAGTIDRRPPRLLTLFTAGPAAGAFPPIGKAPVRER